jgi:Undecaprenyl-phosphate glucose phosphotransferase
MQAALESDLGPHVLRPNQEAGFWSSSLPRRSLADMRREARLPGLLRLGDACVILLSGIAFLDYREAAALPSFASPWIVVLCATLGAANVLTLFGAYASSTLLNESLSFPVLYLARAFFGVLTTLVVIIAAGALATPAYPAGEEVLGWLLSSVSGTVALRLAVRHRLLRMRAQGRLARNVAVVAHSRQELEMARKSGENAASFGNLIGIFSDRFADDRLTGSLDDLLRMAKSIHIDEIRFGIALERAGDLEAAVRKLSAVPTELRLDPVLTRAYVRPPSGFDLPPLTIKRRPLAGWDSAVKRTEDVFCAALLLLFVAPLFGIIMLLVRLDSPGPIFFRQQRLGLDNNPFNLVKFRTMFHEVEDPAIPQARRNDPRITRLGAYLRRTSLDELPQLLNVLHGDMSLVGPRPHAIAHNEKYSQLIDCYSARHRVRPGLTGWAQVRGWRGETATLELMRRRVEHDLYYIDNWSLGLDIYIIFRTFPVVLLGKNAW